MLLSLIFSCIGESCSDRRRWTSFETPATGDQLPGPFYKGENINIYGFLYLTCCCRNIITIWGEEELKSIPMYFLTVLEVRSLKSGFPQGWAPFRSSEGGSLLPLPAPGAPAISQPVAASLQPLPLSSRSLLCVSSLMSACLSGYWLLGLGPALMIQNDLNSGSWAEWHPHRLLFQWRSDSWLQVDIYFGRTPLSPSHRARGEGRGGPG